LGKKKFEVFVEKYTPKIQLGWLHMHDRNKSILNVSVCYRNTAWWCPLHSSALVHGPVKRYWGNSSDLVGFIKYGISWEDWRLSAFQWLFPRPSFLLYL